MKKYFLSSILVFLLLIGIYQCGSSSTNSGSTQPAIDSADFDTVSPCSDRDTLPNDADFFTAITNATAFRFFHLTFTSDGDLPAICGLDPEWNPTTVNSNRTNESVAFSNIATYFDLTSRSVSNGAEICRTGFGFSTDTALGFPVAGEYHFDSCIDSGSDSYSVRVRLTISGTDADKTLTAAGVSSLDDLRFCDSNGNEITSASDLQTLITSSDGSGTMTVGSNSCATTHITVLIEIICVKKQTSESCPTT